MPLVSPSSTAASATPARVKRTGLNCPPPWLPVKATINEATSAPAKAIASCSCADEYPNSAAPSTMAKLAPAFTPSKPGSASGFRVRVCINAPARPSAPPASKPARVRGSRASSTMVQSALWQVPERASSTTEAGSDFAPMSRLNAVAIISNNSNPGTAMARVTATEPDIRTSMIMKLIIVIDLIWIC